MGKSVREKKNIFDESREERPALTRLRQEQGGNIFCVYFVSPRSESWLGRAAVLGDGRCAVGAVLMKVPTARAPSQPLLLPQPCEAIPAGSGTVEPCGGCRSSIGSDPSHWPHL